MYSRQFILILRETQTARTRATKIPNGSSQLGLRTMSSKVAFGEKKTPMIRPKGLTNACGCACASGIGAGCSHPRTPPPQDLKLLALDRNTHADRRKFQGGIVARKWPTVDG